MLVIKVPGLCIGGLGVGDSEEIGYIVMTRKQSGADKLRTDFYLKNVLIPFIERMRTTFDDAPESGGIRDDQWAVAWMDGNLPQVHAVANNPELLEMHKIIVNKQNAARTGVEQVADQCKVFETNKLLTKITTVSSLDPGRHPMKRAIVKALESEDVRNVLCLDLKKRNCLVDFLSTLPANATKAAS
jgi:hypothetical protein